VSFAEEMLGATVLCTCNKIIAKSVDGVEKIHAKVWLKRGNRIFAVCKSCNGEVELPFTVVPDRVVAPDPGPPLYLTK
jgi:hypothetical protein